MKTSSIVSHISRAILAIAFIVSGILKLYPVEFFENDLLIHHLGSELLVMFEARLLIASELIIGIGILLAIYDKLFLSLSFVSLALYTLYLSFIVVTEGNSGNCGCMGNAISLSPAEGIMKNIFLLSLTYWVWQQPIKWSTRWRNAVVLFFGVLSLTAPFVLNPLSFPNKVATAGGEKNVLPLELLYTLTSEKAPTFDLTQGKKIIAFFLLNCSHCKLAATRFEAIKRSHPELPIYLILCGEKQELSKFLRETNMSQLPYSYFSSLHYFMKMSGPDFPAIYLVNNKIVDAQLAYNDINSAVLKTWYEETKSDTSRD